MAMGVATYAGSSFVLLVGAQPRCALRWYCHLAGALAPAVVDGCLDEYFNNAEVPGQRPEKLERATLRKEVLWPLCILSFPELFDFTPYC
jgi:hypothetical protein